jgi:hypothetical protein
MLLIAGWAKAEGVRDVKQYVAGSDAVLLHTTSTPSGARDFQKIAGSLPSIPWGGWLSGNAENRVKTMVEADCDFLVIPSASPVLAFAGDDRVGKILQVGLSLSEGMLRAINGLSVDAVLSSEAQERDYLLTWHRLILFQHFASLLTKPMLVTAPSNVTGDELKAIWEAGVDGVIVETGSGQPGRLAELSKIISDSNFLPPRRRKKSEAPVPRIGMETGTMPDIEEEE